MRAQRSTSKVLMLLAFAAGGLWMGCSRSDSPPRFTAEEKSMSAPGEAAQGMIASDAVASAPPPAPSPPSVGRVASEASADQVKTLSDTSVMPGMIIRNGAASVRVDSLEPAVARVKLIAAQLGGYIANTQMQTGESQVRSATLELKTGPNGSRRPARPENGARARAGFGSRE